MKDLIDLVKIVTKTKLREVELLGNKDDAGSKMREFYEMVADGRVATDEEAASYFYSADKASPAYQKLRRSLKDRLLNSLFVIDLKQPSYTDRQRAYYECYREWAAAKILFGKNAGTAAVGLAQKLLKVAKRYEFTELLVDICHSLRLYHGTIDGDVKAYEQYNELLKKWQQIWIHENLAEEYYTNIGILFINSRATHVEMQETIRAYYEELRDALDKHDTYQLHLCGRLLEVNIYTVVNDYRSTLEVCERALSFFKKKDYISNVPFQVFYYQKFLCHVQLRETEAAHETAAICLEYLEEGKFNWFKFYELYFIFLLHSESYEAGREVYDRVARHSSFGNLPDNVKETWKIVEGYLYFLECAGKLSMPKDGPRVFKMSKFLNEIRVFSKDKQGMNIPVLILELLIGLVERKYDIVIDRAEGIDKYRSRYLKSKEHRRSNIFFKMLMLAPRCGFNRATTATKAALLYAELKSVPIEMANQTYEIEVLPHEKAWEYMLERLED